jgi:hypothetical protein
MIDYIDSFPNDERNDMRRFFIHPGVFDGFVAVLAQELRKKPMRPHLCDSKARMALISQFVTKVRQQLGDIEVRSFAEICEHIPMMTLQLRKGDLHQLGDLQARDVINYKLYLQGYHKFCHHHWRPQEVRSASFPRFKGNNTGMLFWGERGTGKSQILSYMTAWAHENNWINMTISNHHELIDGSQESFRYKNGLYLQFELGK